MRLTMVVGFGLANKFSLIKWYYIHTCISLFIFTVKVRCGLEFLNGLVLEEKVSL
ncbi:hypothetical protein Hanom_Chr17g01587361 [Helianthus anomalus]